MEMIKFVVFGVRGFGLEFLCELDKFFFICKMIIVLFIL